MISFYKNHSDQESEQHGDARGDVQGQPGEGGRGPGQRLPGAPASERLLPQSFEDIVKRNRQVRSHLFKRKS